MSLPSLCVPLAALLLGGSPLADVPSAPLADAVPAPSPLLVIRAPHVAIGDGQHLANVLIVIEAGRIKSVGAGEVPAGANLIEHAGWVTPGFVAGWGLVGHPAEYRETTSAFQEGLDLAPTIDPLRPGFEDPLAAGVTCVLPASNPQNVIAGSVPAVKFAPSEDQRARFVGPAALLISMGTPAVNRGRFPTSYSGLIQALDERAADAEGRLAEVKSGKLLLTIDLEERHEVQRALGWSSRHGLRPLLRGPTLAGEMLAELESAGAGVVVPPFGFGASGRTLDALVLLSQGRVPFAFALGEPQDFRLPAAVALAHGADRAALERALWAGAASLVGGAGRVGAVRVGADADLVLWSADPLDLASRPELVLIDGREVFRADPLMPAHPTKAPRLGVKPAKANAR
jgi:hypothetical protein